MLDPTPPASDARYEESFSEDRQAALSVTQTIRPPSVVHTARPSRWRKWLVLLAVLVGLRVVVSIVLGPFAEERLSRVLGARVQVGDVSFAPIDAVVTLRNVTVQRDEDATPAIRAGRVRVDVQWLPLLHRGVVVRELALESAVIDVDRDAGTNDGLTRFARVDPATELPPGWSFALDRVALRDTRLRLRDDGARPALDVHVRDAQVATRERRASAFKRAPNLHVDAFVDGGRIRVDGSSDLRSQGVVVDAFVRVKDVPLKPLQSYLPEGEWTGIDGRLSGRLHYQRDPERRDLLDGRLRVRRIQTLADGAAPVMAIREVDAEVDAIDLRNRRVAIRSLMLHGARLTLGPELGAAKAMLDRVASLAGGAPPPQVRPAGFRPADAPWTWTVRRAETRATQVHVAGADGEIVLAAGLSGENLGPRAYWSPLKAWVARGDGVAEFDGSVRLSRGLRMDGRLTARDVDFPAFARAVGLPGAELAQTGRGSAVLDVEVEPGATDVSKVGVRGDVAVDDVWLAGGDADAFAVGARAVQFTLAGIAQESAARGQYRPAEVQITEATVTAPYVQLTRTASGWLVPPFATDVVTPVIAAGEVPAVPAAPPAATMRLGRLRATGGGRVIVVDQDARPQIALDLNVSEGWARNVRMPDATVGEFAVRGWGRPFGEIQLAGSGGRARGDFEVRAPSLPLVAATPYLARAGLPYWFVDGTGSVSAQVAYAGDYWEADTLWTLRAPRFGGDQLALERSLGMASEEALAALRDHAGEATLHLPLMSPRGDWRVAFDGMVAAAFRDSIARARQAPIPNAPTRIAFVRGASALGPDTERQLEAIADVLAARPDAVVELSGDISRDDRRGLAEQAAARHLPAPGAFKGVLRVFGVRDQDTRIRDALAARAEGRPGRLDAQDEAALNELTAESPPVDEGRLLALVAERLRRVADALAKQHGVSTARIVVRDPGRDESSGPPTVQVAIDGRAYPRTLWAEAGRW